MLFSNGPGRRKVDTENGGSKKAEICKAMKAAFFAFTINFCSTV